MGLLEWNYLTGHEISIGLYIIWIKKQEEKGMTEEEMVGWHHQLNGHEFG